ncbi:MAG: hypothetical protein M3Q19_00830 [Pseudomonadota bacterium]|nr:hypothetical protein [Pseudomonadota bacterium]
MARKSTSGSKSRKRKPAPSVHPEEFRDEIRTLQHWRSRLQGPRTIECREIKLWGRDAEGAIISGPGRIQVISETDIRFWVYGTAENDGHAFAKITEAQRNPYDHMAQFRVFATDYEGLEWTGGYTQVRFFADTTHAWPLTGELDALTVVAIGHWVAKESSVELLLIPPIELPLGEWSETVTRLKNEVVSYSRRPGCQVVKALGTKILFEMDTAGDALWITAKTSEKFTHPQAENWLTEPLRILFGALIYPRLMARNFGDGRSFVTLRPAPAVKRPSPMGLLPPFPLPPNDRDQFWKLYAAILTMIVKSPESERPFLQGHQVTRLYQELAQAERGSRWVILLTLASTAEALAKSIMRASDRKSEFPKKVLDSMQAHIEAWQTDSGLRDRMLSNLANVRSRSVLAFMRKLAERSVVDLAHVATWRRLRNSVMHGELVEPWSTEEGDQHLQEMIELVHSLTRARIAKR